MVDLVKHIDASKRTYIDDHSWWEKREEEIETVLVVQTYTKNGSVKASSKEETADLTFLQKWCWIAPSSLRMFPTEDYIHCKNGLYLGDDGKIHLTTCAQGLDVQKEECYPLRDGKMVKQVRGEWSNFNDYNFILPYTVFRNVLLTPLNAV